MMGGGELQVPMHFDLDLLPDLPRALPPPEELPGGLKLEVVPIEPAVPDAPPADEEE